MKAIKYLFYIVLVLIILVVAGGLLLAKFVDPNDYKDTITAKVEEKTGRKLSIDGDLSLTWFPWVGVTTNALKLSDAAGFSNDSMVEVERAEVKVKLLPLFKKKLEIDTIILDKPRIRLARNQQGVSNWDDLISGQSKPEESKDTDSPVALAGLAVQGVSLVDGIVYWKDEQGQQDITISDLNLSTGKLVPGEPLDIMLSLRAEGNQIPAATDLTLKTTVIVNENLELITLANTDFSAESAALAAQLNIEKVSYALDAGLAVLTSVNGKVVHDSVETKLNVASVQFNQSDLSIDLPSINLSQGGSVFTGAISGSQLASEPNLKGAFDLKLESVNELIETNQIPVSLNELNIGSVAATAAFEFDGRVASVSGLSFDGMVNQLETSLSAPSIRYDYTAQTLIVPGVDIRQDDFVLSGQVSGDNLISDGDQRSIVFDGEIAVADVAKLLERNGINLDLPALDLTDIHIVADVSMNGTAIQSNKFDGSVNYLQQPTSIKLSNGSFDLASGAVDVESLLVGQGDFNAALDVKGAGVLGDLENMQLDGSVDVQSADVIELIARNQIPVEIPEGIFKTVSADLKFRLSDGDFAVEQLDTEIDEMKIKGSLAVENISQPYYRFDLDINRIDVDALTEALPEGEEKPSTAEQLLLPVEPLRGLVADGRVSIGQLITTGMVLENVELTIDAEEDVIQLKPVSAETFGGTVNLSAVYDISRTDPSIDFRSDVKNVDIGGLLTALDISNKIEGTGNLTSSITTTGASQDRILSSLNGDIGFQLLDGAIKGYDLQDTLVKVKTGIAQLQGDDEVSDLQPEEKTKFAELSGTFIAENGVFRNNDLEMKAPLFRVNGGGDINIPDSSINYRLKVNVVDSVEGQGGQALKDLRGAEIPLKISGLLTDPKIVLDIGQLLKDSAKKEAKKKLLEKLGVESVEEGAAQNLGQDNSTSLTEELLQAEEPEEVIKEELKKKLKKSIFKSLGLE